LLHHSHLITLTAYLCSQWAPNVEIKYFMFYWSIYRLFLLNRSWKRHSLQITISEYPCLACSVVELKSRFETWKARNDAYGVSLFHLHYLITLMAYLCSQWTQNVQIKYFMFDWLMYRIFVLNTRWIRDSLQIIVFANVCSTCSMFQLKTCFETSILRNDVNGVSLFHVSYLITIVAYLSSQWTPKAQIYYFFVWFFDLHTICVK
jgi:hypothetical protein